MTTPIVDVLMPTYNAGTFLVEAIESILKQDFSDWTLTVLDGGSVDATIPILNHYAKLDERITMVPSPGTPPTKRVNEAIRHSCAEFIAFHHADDISAPSRFKKQIQAFRDDTALVLAGTAIQFWLHNKQNPKALGYEKLRHYPQEHLEILAKLPFYWCFSLPSLMFRRGPLVENDILFNTKYTYCADYDWFYRVSKKFKTANLTEVLLSYRDHDSSDGKTNKKFVDQEKIEIQKTIGLLEFSNFSEADLKILSEFRIEQEKFPEGRLAYQRLHALMDDKLKTIQDEISKQVFFKVYSEYLSAVKTAGSASLRIKKEFRRMLRKLQNHLA